MQALYAGDYETATRDAQFVVRAVFRSDYQVGALFTLALAAERLGAFSEAGALFGRALDMIPAMAAQHPLRRARALLTAHAALDLAAALQWCAIPPTSRRDASLARCLMAVCVPLAGSVRRQPRVAHDEQDDDAR